MIFVTHDIGVAIEVADHIAVMYAGHIVEIGDCRDVVRAPAHPYTQGLLAAGADRAPFASAYAGKTTTDISRATRLRPTPMSLAARSA